MLGTRSEKRRFSVNLTCQCIELFVLLFLVRFSSQLPNPCVVPIISFVAAMQMTSFDAFGPWSFNSATTTGNIKSATVSIVLWLRGQDRSKNRGAAIVSVLACVAFLLGALFGGSYTSRHPTRALLPCVCLGLGCYQAFPSSTMCTVDGIQYAVRRIQAVSSAEMASGSIPPKLRLIRGANIRPDLLALKPVETAIERALCSRSNSRS
jgi:Protein of unknown function (DUF1275)